MNYFEKIGLVLIITFVSKEFPEVWRGAEAIIFFIGSVLFLGGKYIQSWVLAFQKV